MATSHVNTVFICPTIHYIGKNFQLQNSTLKFKEFHGAHTGEAIRVEMDDIIGKLDLPESCHVFALNYDGTNIVLATSLSTCITDDMRCMFHMLKFCIQDCFRAIPGMKTTADKCKRVAGHVHHSPKGEETLRDECSKFNIMCCKLITPVCTCWNSQWMCMKSYCDVKEALIILTRFPAFHEIALTPQEWDMVEGRVTMLWKFKDVSELWSGDSCPMSEEVILAVFDLHSHLKTFVKGKRSDVCWRDDKVPREEDQESGVRFILLMKTVCICQSS